MLHKGWKNDHARVLRFRLLPFACALIILLLCSGCAMLLPAPTPTPVMIEQVQKEPEETPVPEEENPLKAFLNGFYQAYAPYDAALRALSEEDSSAVDEALAAERHMLRLKQLFNAQADLWQNPSDKELWDGILFGGMEGTGSVRKTSDGCTFSCTLTELGSITGSLKGMTLVAQWAQQDEVTRSGAIIKTDTGYAASVHWDGEEVLLLIDDDVLSFGAGRQATATVSSLSPDQWASWCLKDGILFVPGEAAASTTMQEDIQ